VPAQHHGRLSRGDRPRGCVDIGVEIAEPSSVSQQLGSGTATLAIPRTTSGSVIRLHHQGASRTHAPCKKISVGMGPLRRTFLPTALVVTRRSESS